MLSEAMFPEVTRDDVFRIETRRLWLRWPRVQDAAAVAKLANNPHLAEMTGVIPHPYPRGEEERFIFEQRKKNAMGTMLSYAITPRNRPDVFMGRIGSRILPSGPSGRARCSLGYWLGEPYWNQGFATEAAHGLIDAIFAFTEMDEIIAHSRVANTASRRVMEKCGFQFAGSSMIELPEIRGAVPADTLVLSRSTWTSLKSWREPRIELDRHERAAPTARELAACA
jgi:RimJ/RimL family protein N-acetyltransferase